MFQFLIGCVVGFVFYLIYRKTKNKSYKMIVIQISELTIERLPFKKDEVIKSIRYAYWQGAINKRQKIKLELLLSHKYTEIYKMWVEEERRKDDESYERFLSRYKT